MKPLRIARFLRDTTAAATVEFVIVFVPLILIIFFIFEMAMAYHWALAAQKGVENGVRLAVTQDPINTALLDARGDLLLYQLSPGTDPGDACFFGANCSSIATVSCTGGSNLAAECDAGRFQQLFNTVGRQAYGLEPEDLTITYEESGLGRATEPVIPIITVSIASREFPLALRLFGVDAQLPVVSASLIGEFLAN